MATVRTKQEAVSWFLANSSGTVEAVREDGSTAEFDNYPECERWFDEPATGTEVDER